MEDRINGNCLGISSYAMTGCQFVVKMRIFRYKPSGNMDTYLIEFWFIYFPILWFPAT
jgi:hypothetical protein